MPTYHLVKIWPTIFSDDCPSPAENPGSNCFKSGVHLEILPSCYPVSTDNLFYSFLSQTGRLNMSWIESILRRKMIPAHTFLHYSRELTLSFMYHEGGRKPFTLFSLCLSLPWWIEWKNVIFWHITQFAVSYCDYTLVYVFLPSNFVFSLRNGVTGEPVAVLRWGQGAQAPNLAPPQLFRGNLGPTFPHVWCNWFYSNFA